MLFLFAEKAWLNAYLHEMLKAEYMAYVGIYTSLS